MAIQQSQECAACLPKEAWAHINSVPVLGTIVPLLGSIMQLPVWLHNQGLKAKTVFYPIGFLSRAGLQDFLSFAARGSHCNPLLHADSPARTQRQEILCSP